jgi:hypothetical protein
LSLLGGWENGELYRDGVEPRSLVREALVSLMESNSYHVVCSVGAAADIERSAFEEVQPKLVILEALPAERASDVFFLAFTDSDCK